MKKVKNLYSVNKGYWHMFIICALLVMLARFSYSYVPILVEYLIARLTDWSTGAGVTVNLPSFILDYLNNQTDRFSMIFSICMVSFTWQFSRYLLLLVQDRAIGKFNEGVAYSLRITTYNDIQDLSYQYHNNADSGDLIQRVTSDIDTTSNFSTRRTLDVISILTTLASGIFQLSFINPWIMLVTLSLVPITIAVSIFFFKKMEKIFAETEEKESELMVVIQENVSASRVVRSFGNEEFEIKKLEEKNKAYRDIEYKVGKYFAVYWGIMDFVSIIQFLVAILLGIYFVKIGTMAMAQVASTLMLIGMLIYPVRNLGRLVSDFGKALVSAQRLQHIFDQESEYINDGTENITIKGHIVFKNMSFKFEDSNSYILENINFEIKPNETVAFVGKAGSGKSTILNILLKMYDYEGSITVDGVELREIKKKSIRSQIGTVLQSPFLFSKSVYENIKIANPEATEDEILNASKIAALHKDINTFNDGYETLVGEQGVTLSGGQKQRVAIARILVSNKPIIIFDDALSALDNKTDLAIRDALSQTDSKRTSLIITHRIATAKQADKIIVINDHKVEAVGIHNDLANKPGLYKTLWDIQGSLEDEFLKMVKENENA